MTVKFDRALTLWAGALGMALLGLLPLALGPRLALALALIVLLAFVWTRAGRRAAQICESLNFADIASLPSVFYRQPVVLVCGGGQLGLFGVNADEYLKLRQTERGCYVQVPDVEQLPQVVAGLLVVRPDWESQISVMYVVNPAEQNNHAALADQVRALSQQMKVAEKHVSAIPLLLVSYLKASLDEDVWFSWEGGENSAQVCHAGGSISVSGWQQQTTDPRTRSQRLHAIVQLKSIAGWLSEAVTPHLASGRDTHRALTPLACAVCLVSALPESATNNLWQQWHRDKTALADPRSPSPSAGQMLAFPDPLLALLPRHSGDTAARRFSVTALWMFVICAVFALTNSAWQNTLMVRQINDDLVRYASSTIHRTQSAFARREDALNVLRQDAQRLDDYYRQGEPLSLGLGLYRGEHLRRPLWDAIASYRPPLPEKPARHLDPVRLDSLSLFNTGSAELKPGSTKVLINALVGIKAQSGWLIVVTGHTDATGSPEQNLQLSWARAAAVRGWMQRMGDIPDSCFAVQGFGASQPIASNETAQGRAANRRVDIRLVPEEGACVLLATAPGRQPLSPSATVEN